MGKAFIAVFVVAVLFVSCEFNQDVGSVTIGEGFIHSETTLAMVDTFSVSMSTVLLDSLRTSGDTVVWVGKYSDKELGEISASSYFALGVPGDISVEKKDIFDSLTLVMNYSRIYYGDTSGVATISVHQLKSELKGDDNGYLWNNSFFPYYDKPLGIKSFLPKPHSGKKVQIRLSDDFGRRLFDMMKNSNDTVKSTDLFRDFFQGVVLKGGDQNNAILQFRGDTSMAIRVHYHRIGLEKESFSSAFSLTASTLLFNKVVANRKGTALQNIVTRKDEIPSFLSGNKSFMQSGTGLLARVDFPSMQRLMEFDRKYVIFKAELMLVPEPGSYDKIDLPSQLVLYHTDRTNQVVSEIVGSDNSILPGELKVDKAFHEDSYYRFDITDFLTTEIADAHFDTGHGLLIGETSSKMGFSLNRVVFGAHYNTVHKPVVRIYFMFYK